MDFFSSVPLVNKVCPNHLDHNRLARAFNQRLARSGPDCMWRIFYYADSIFTGMRSTANPGVPLGINPPEDEWWKVYMNIEYPTASSGIGNWPLTLAGVPQGASLMNPLNAYIFNKQTSENKFLDKQGPHAEGHLFDGVVASSKAVLSNKQYWEDAFMQRGAVSRNTNYGAQKVPKDQTLSFGKTLIWNKYPQFDFEDSPKISAKFLPSSFQKAYFSKSLTTAAYSSDKHFQEYASQHVYMRYPPAIQGGAYMKYGQKYSAKHGVLKRKNAAKDLLQWGLWCFVYYFRGSESQRSLFCSRKAWSAEVLDFTSSDGYQKTVDLQDAKKKLHGPLNICDVGFGFYKYFTRQNVFAPALGRPTTLSNSRSGYESLGDTGEMRLEPYRVSFSKSFPNINLSPDNDEEQKKLDNSKAGTPSRAFCVEGIGVANYDYHGKGNVRDLRIMSPYGKIIEFNKINIENRRSGMLLCDYDSYSSSRKGRGFLNFDPISGRGTRGFVKSCLAGYYLETNAIEDQNSKFKFRIWSNNIILHETIISNKYSYRVNRNGVGKPAHIFNKVFYFKEGLLPSGTNHKFRFQIVPIIENTRDSVEGSKNPSYMISLGNPWSHTVLNTNEMLAYEDIALENVAVNGTTATATSTNNHQLSTGSIVTIMGSIAAIEQFEEKEYEITVPDGEEGNKTFTFDVEQGTGGVGSSTAQVTKIFSQSDDGPSYIQDKVLSGKFDTGDIVRIKASKKTKGTGYMQADGTMLSGYKDYWLNSGNPVFVRKGEEDKLYFYVRQDDRLTGTNVNEKPYTYGSVDIYSEVVLNPDDKYASEKIVIEKLDNPDNLLKVKVDLAVLQKRKPSFQDAYALLRATTAKSNRRNSESDVILGDAPGVGPVGHHFSEANRVFRNYFKYGSASNIYGSPVVPALQMYVSANPVYESMRKFVSSFMRFADRQQLLNYTVEGGKGVLYFKRFIRDLPKQYKPTILRNMEPSIDPAGWFVERTNDDTNPGHARFVPIKVGKKYRVACNSGGGLYYNGNLYGNGGWFIGVAGKNSLDSIYGIQPDREGAFEEDGIDMPYGSNNWLMFMTSSHYKSASTSIYKPAVFNDIMGFLNNRCHHRSKEYEYSHGIKYDMIRSELCRTPVSPRNVPGSQLHIFLSKSSNNFNYIFNTNDPSSGNVELYANRPTYVSDYLKSCPVETPSPYKVISTRIVDEYGKQPTQTFNPSARDITDRRTAGAGGYRGRVKRPYHIVRVEIYPPLRGTGGLSVGSSGWVGVDRETLKKEPYRSDENAVIEYLHYKGGNYSCNRSMVGDYGAETKVIEGDGYRPQGACFPRFYFLKQIPFVRRGDILDTEPYAQMDFYARAMSSSFINPFPISSLALQTSSLSWKFGEIASRASEEDPTMYNYVDPRDIQT